MDMVYIILVNYKNYNVTMECIESIKNINNINYNYKIILVENGSKNGSEKIFKHKYNDIVLLLSDKNIGFSGGNNLGIRYALKNNADYILLLNNDTIVEPDFLNYLMLYADNTTAVAPKIYYFDSPNRIWYAGGKICFQKGKCMHYHMKQIDKMPCDDSVKNCTFATGCCLLLHRNIVNKIGLLDDKFFMYFEDTDYCIRLLKAGFKINYVPQAKIWHKVSSSSGGENSKLSIYYMERNRLYLLHKHAKHFYPFGHIYTYITRLLKILFYNIANKDYKQIYLQAFNDYKNNKMGKFRKD